MEMPLPRVNQARRVIIFCTCFILLLLSPWLLGGLAILSLSTYGRIDKWRNQTTSEFSQARWKKPDLKYRYSVLQEVIRQQIKPGMTPTDVKSRLGEPDAYVNGGWQYEARQPGWQLIDWEDGGLLISFSEQNVVVT